MLISSGNTVINLALVQSIETIPHPSGDKRRSRARFTFNDGRVFFDDSSPAGWFEPYLGTLMSAPPGNRVIRACGPYGQEPGFFDILPVIAFRHEGRCPEGVVKPVTDEGEPDGSDWALVRPSGEVTNWDRTWSDIAAFEADYRERWAAAAKQAASDPAVAA